MIPERFNNEFETKVSALGELLILLASSILLDSSSAG